MTWDKDTQVAYMRAQAEYDVAWVEFYDDICEVIRKYNGKKATKRIGTALKKIDNRISFSIEKGYLNYINIGWYDYDGRIFKVKDDCDCSDNRNWAYLNTKESSTKIAMYYAKDDIDCINADNLIKSITAARDYATKCYNETMAALENLDSLKEEYDKARTVICEVMGKIPHNIQRYYGLDKNSVCDWGYFRVD